jgi:hypothetical protein
MATLFDIGLLQYFTPIFIFLLVWAVTYGALEVTKVLGENKSWHAIIALSAAFLLAFTSKPLQIMQSMTPWFVLFFIFILFLLVGMRFMFGAGADEMLINMLGGSQGAGWWVFLVSIAIVGISIGSIIGPEQLPGGTGNATTTQPAVGPGESTDTGSWRTNVLNTIYNPKVLGAVVVLVIALFTIKLMSAAPVLPR